MTEAKLNRHLETKHKNELRLPVKDSAAKLVSKLKSVTSTGSRLIRMETVKSIVGNRMWADVSSRKKMYKRV